MIVKPRVVRDNDVHSVSILPDYYFHILRCLGKVYMTCFNYITKRYIRHNAYIIITIVFNFFFKIHGE